MQRIQMLLLVGLLAAACGLATAQKAGCKTALDLIADQAPQLPLHPVFQNILASPDLRGTFFVPTGAAWDDFFTTLRQRKGNPESPQLIARYGQILLYHLAQDGDYKGVKVPIAEATPGVNKFLVSTASTLQCSVGDGLPNNKILVTKTPQAVMLRHGTGNATIRSQPIPYCGGEAFLVNQVLNPCSDVSAVMGEVANVPSPCRNNLESVFMRDDLTSFHNLLLATGLSRNVYTTVQNFTVFAPTNAALESAFQTGDLDYATMFAKDKASLIGQLAYHIVPMSQYAEPNRATAAGMPTLLSEVGKVSCGVPKLTWRQDGYVYGGTGSAAVRSSDQGCNTLFYPISSVLQPCCRKLEALLSGPRALDSQAAKGGAEAKAWAFLKAKAAEGGAGRVYFVMPTEAAWQQLRSDAAAAKQNLTKAQVDGLLEYLYTRAPVTNDVVQRQLPVPTGLSRDPGALAAVCGKRQGDGMLRLSFDGTGSAAPAAPTLGQPMGRAAQPAAAAAAPLQQQQPAAGAGYPYPQQQQQQQQQLVAGRRLAQESTGLLLPTVFTMSGASEADGTPLTGNLMVVDGAAPTVDAAIPVKHQTHACDVSIFHVDTVPLPCAFVPRTVVALPPPAPPSPPPAPAAPMMLDANATAANATAPGKSGAGAAAAPAAAAVAAALLIGAVLL